MSLKTLIVIPARRHSTRLANKMLLAETGKSLIEHTFEAARKNSKTDRVVVATDDQEIFDTVEAFGGRAEMTSAEHRSGSDRVAEVAARYPDFDIVVNLQGDEPEISAAAIDKVITVLEQKSAADVATLATPIRSRDSLNDPSCVKVVLGQEGRAVYFSRSPIPYARTWSDDLLTTEPANFLQHIGVYAYRREFLLGFSNLPASYLEQLESLEQLRILSAGYGVYVDQIDEPIFGIDTAEDYQMFVRKYNSQ